MTTTIIAVTFEVDAQHHKDGQFTVPKKVCDLLELKSGDEIKVAIKSSSATFEITKKLSSGTEIYGTDISRHVKAGDRIIVTVSRP